MLELGQEFKESQDNLHLPSQVQAASMLRSAGILASASRGPGRRLNWEWLTLRISE